MAKDPAMLWYWGDWNSGTSLMSRFLKGCYMDVLHAQFNHGHLSLEEIKICLGSDFGSSWPTLQKKFIKDPAGLFFNERLEIEKEKRKAFTKSRSNNKSGAPKKSYDKSYDNHVNNHMDNENRNKDEFVFKGGTGETFLWTDVVKKFTNDYLWKEKFCRDEECTLTEIDGFMEEFIKQIDLSEDFKPVKELKSHFFNTYRKKKRTNATVITSPKRSSNSAGAEQLLSSLKTDIASYGRGNQGN